MSKKADNEIEVTEKKAAAENLTPAATEAVSVIESKEGAPKTETPKKRGRKSSVTNDSTPAAQKGKTVSAKNKKSAAAKSETVSEVKAETPKEETPKKRGRKSNTEKAEAPAAKKKSASASRSKKTTEANKEVTAEVVKAEAPGTDAPKKRGRKSGTTNSKAAAGKGGRKKAVTRDAIIDAAKKRMKAADISKIKYPIALNLEINNFDGEDNKYIYILVNDGEISVEPYRYNDYDFSFRGDAENILNIMNGKTNIYDAFANGLIKIDGNNIKKAILFINAAF